MSWFGIIFLWVTLYLGRKAFMEELEYYGWFTLYNCVYILSFCVAFIATIINIIL